MSERAFDEKNLKTQPLGKFIESSVEGLYKKFAAESGTLKDKLNFAKKAVGKLKRIEDLSQEAILLTEKIYNFIKENNFN